MNDVMFNVCRSMKQPRDMSVISVIDTIDEVVEVEVAKQFLVETLVVVPMNFDGEHKLDFE